MSHQPYALAVVPLGKSSCYLLNRRLSLPPEHSAHFGKEKNPLLPLGFKLWIVQPTG